MASKRAQRRTRCGKKRKFDKAGALLEATRLRRATNHSMDAYCCEFCGHWHVGHRPSRVQGAINTRRRDFA